MTFTPAGGNPIVRTFTFAGVTADTDLGDLFVGPEEVTLTGTVQDSTTNQGLSGVLLKIAGRQAISASDGSFAIPGVAFSSNTQTVFFGLQGIATRTNFFESNFSPTSSPINGTTAAATRNGPPPPIGPTTPSPGSPARSTPRRSSRTRAANGSTPTGACCAPAAPRVPTSPS